MAAGTYVHSGGGVMMTIELCSFFSCKLEGCEEEGDEVTERDKLVIREGRKADVGCACNVPGGIRARHSRQRYVIVALSSSSPARPYPGAGQFVRRAFPVRHGNSEKMITKPRGAGRYFRTG